MFDRDIKDSDLIEVAKTFLLKPMVSETKRQLWERYAELGCPAERIMFFPEKKGIRVEFVDGREVTLMGSVVITENPFLVKNTSV